MISENQYPFVWQVRDICFPSLYPIVPQRQWRSLHVPQLGLNGAALAFSKLARTARAQGCIWGVYFQGLLSPSRDWQGCGRAQGVPESLILVAQDPDSWAMMLLAISFLVTRFWGAGCQEGGFLPMEKCIFWFSGEIHREPPDFQALMLACGPLAPTQRITDDEKLHLYDRTSWKFWAVPHCWLISLALCTLCVAFSFRLAPALFK